MINIVFKETSVFTRQIVELLSDDQYRGLQKELALRPDSGVVIRQSGGIRKIRWGTEAKGKCGGIRVIYYWLKENNEIFMLLAYQKGIKDNLTAEETRILRRLVEENLR